jgi:hypothetical protein
LPFCDFQFSFLFFFLHLLDFDHPQNKSNLVCLTLVFIDLFLLSSFCILCLLLTLTGDGWLPLQETQTFFVDDPGKLYMQRRCATQAKGLETQDSKAEVEGPPESPRESPPPSPKEDQPKPTSLIYLS